MNRFLLLILPIFDNPFLFLYFDVFLKNIFYKLIIIIIVDVYLMAKVVVQSTSPETVVSDYGSVMDQLQYKSILKQDLTTVIKINLSWSLFFPACSTPPWQLDGILSKLVHDGYKDIVPVENQTVVTHPWKGAYLNKWLPIMKNLNLEYRPLTNEEWITYKPKADMLGMYELFGEDGIIIPKVYQGSNMIHLPTMKTHGHSVTTGAMKNAFGGLIPKYRHHSHAILDEVLVDLLAIQKEIHRGLMALMDGTVAGIGAGRRTMTPYYANTLLGCEDQVAIDAVSAKLMGFDPFKIKYIKLAHDRGLGVGDVDQIEIIGSIDRPTFNETSFGFKTKKSLVIKWDQRIRKTTYNHRPLKPLHWFMFKTPFFRLFIAASYIYHDLIWYPFTGKKIIRDFNKTDWGELFENYSYGEEIKNYPAIINWNKY